VPRRLITAMVPPRSSPAIRTRRESKHAFAGPTFYRSDSHLAAPRDRRLRSTCRLNLRARGWSSPMEPRRVVPATTDPNTQAVILDRSLRPCACSRISRLPRRTGGR
jgi:hypothetical protein